MYVYLLKNPYYIFLVQNMINAAYQKPDGAKPEPSIKMKRPVSATQSNVLSNGISGHRP